MLIPGTVCGPARAHLSRTHVPLTRGVLAECRRKDHTRYGIGSPKTGEHPGGRRTGSLRCLRPLFCLKHGGLQVGKSESIAIAAGVTGGRDKGPQNRLPPGKELRTNAGGRLWANERILQQDSIVEGTRINFSARSGGNAHARQHLGPQLIQL